MTQERVYWQSHCRSCCTRACARLWCATVQFTGYNASCFRRSRDSVAQLPCRQTFTRSIEVAAVALAIQSFERVAEYGIPRCSIVGSICRLHLHALQRFLKNDIPRRCGRIAAMRQKNIASGYNSHLVSSDHREIEDLRSCSRAWRQAGGSVTGLWFCCLRNSPAFRVSAASAWVWGWVGEAVSPKHARA
jgi:hypothetical protein